jgi:hypothetical protein
MMTVRSVLKTGLLLSAAFLIGAATPTRVEAQQHRFGLTLGATSSTVNGDYMIGTDSKWGFIGGIYGESRLNRNFASQLGVNYTQKGGKGLSQDGLLDLRINYIEIPLLLQILAPLGSTWDFVAYTGIAAGFAVSCKATIGSDAQADCGDTSLGDSRTEWGLPVGGGFYYELSNGEMVTFDARYTWGLNDAVSAVDINNRTWQFILRLAKQLQ